MECPVCLTLPEGVVHQCHEGHCYCADCWNRLDPRRCPECRLPLPQVNRNRAAERTIAALETCCDHCGEVTTRGAMAAHRRVCPQAPSDAVLADMGLTEAVAALRAHLPVVRVRCAWRRRLVCDFKTCASQSAASKLQKRRG